MDLATGMAEGQKDKDKDKEVVTAHLLWTNGVGCEGDFHVDIQCYENRPAGPFCQIDFSKSGKTLTGGASSRMCF
jgi:hypothetical protein